MKIIRWAAIAAAYVAFTCAHSPAVRRRPRRRCGSGWPKTRMCSIPTLARTYVGRIVFASFCDKLFDIDQNLNVVPQLALSHSTSADGKTVTIKLRPGVKFHDGEPFNAEAAKFSLERHPA